MSIALRAFPGAGLNASALSMTTKTVGLATMSAETSLAVRMASVHVLMGTLTATASALI